MSDYSSNKINKDKLKIFDRYGTRRQLRGKNFIPLSRVRISGEKMDKDRMAKILSDIGKRTRGDINYKKFDYYLSRKLSSKDMKWEDKKKLRRWMRAQADLRSKAIKKEEKESLKLEEKYEKREIEKPKEARSVLSQREFKSPKKQMAEAGAASAFERLGVKPPVAVKEKPKPKTLGGGGVTSSGMVKGGPASIIGNSPKGLRTGSATDYHGGSHFKLAA